MPNWPQDRQNKITRCAVCHGPFGLVRHYSWRTPLCSRKCVDRLRVRRDTERNWIGRLQTTFDELSRHQVRAS